MSKWHVVVKETTYSTFEVDGASDEDEAYKLFVDGLGVDVTCSLDDAEVVEIYELG